MRDIPAGQLEAQSDGEDLNCYKSGVRGQQTAAHGPSLSIKLDQKTHSHTDVCGHFQATQAELSSCDKTVWPAKPKILTTGP